MLTDSARMWVEFADPAEPARVVRADLTWLTSHWSCLFGAGCPGIDADQPDAGCCTLGAHFSDAADEQRVQHRAAELTSADWQHHDLGLREGTVVDTDDGDRSTRVVDGGCIYLNRDGFPGGAGCALHALALRTGREPLALKPDVCWQLPLRRTYREVERPDGSEYLEVSLGEYDRAGWGAGGHDLDWYCTNEAAAHQGTEPVYRSLRAELVELLGAAAYEELTAHCDALLDRQLPLMVHPATAAAAATPCRAVGTEP